MARYNNVFEISHETYNEIEDWMRASELTGRNLQFGLNALASLMARTHQAIAMEKSRGPLRPDAARGQRQYMGRRFIGGPGGEIKPEPIWGPDEAWRIPVRRITSRFYKGWKVRRLAPGVWISFNDSREAFFIEFGISPHGTRVERRGGKAYLQNNRRVRRPINKLALMGTMRFIEHTDVEHRVWAAIFSPFRQGMTGRYGSRANALVNDQVQSLQGMRFV